MTAMIRAEVTKNPNETAASLVRRFTKRVQSSGVLPAAREERYHSRKKSKYVKKKFAIRRIAWTERYNELKRQGRIEDVPRKKSR